MPGVTTAVYRGDVPKMVEHPSGKTPKERAVYRLEGLSQNTLYGVHNSNMMNLRRSLVERVFLVEGPDGDLVSPPRPAPDVYRSRWSIFMAAYRKHLFKATPWSYSEFVAAYHGDRRHRVYQRAVESLLANPLVAKDAWLSTFLKAEKIDLSKKKDPAPRAIQPRSPRFNAFVGRYLKGIEKRVYKSLAGLFGGPTVMKGLNAIGTAAALREMWGSFDNCIAVILDASRFDQHVSRVALECEHEVYDWIYSGDPELRRALSMQLVNKGFARCSDGYIKYTVEGCRMSGDMNTAMGNCLVMCGLVWMYANDRGLTPGRGRGHYRLANNGDDCVIFLDAADLRLLLEGLPEWFTTMGFTMKVEQPVDIFERVEFCQTQPVETGRGWVMVRRGTRCLAKDSTSVLSIHTDAEARSWMTSIGLCGLALAGDVPIQGAFYSRLVEVGGGAKQIRHPHLESGMANLARGMTACTGVTERSRVSFWRAFGIMPYQQIAIEHDLESTVVSLAPHRRVCLSPGCPLVELT